ncbi:hypothetical protein PAPYR_12608 [Paratrimastix pyriformis]|uniref:Uncharacterized protein n=1 Tax=Paratrimastix pyriformis TaxID=342808 RepID=A0ABQ8U3V0_9EUKA|nr:hypothetical protein PAPYR_12608 [Paratrimastix pyriformis]
MTYASTPFWSRPVHPNSCPFGAHRWPGRVPQGTRGELDQTDEFDAAVATGGSGDKSPLGGESGPAGVNNSDDAQHHPSPAIDERTPLIPSGDLPV